MVTSSKFGRYPKISVEQVFNMIESDGWMVPLAGYIRIAQLLENGEGRGIFASFRYKHLIVVINNIVYAITKSGTEFQIGTINTETGDVYIAENEKKEIAICDKKQLWIYNYGTGTFTAQNLDFTPNYVAYQNGRFIAGVTNAPNWRLRKEDDGTWPDSAAFVGSFQTKGADTVLATIPFPSRENLILVMGNIVTELWTDVGANLFPYQKNTAINIDYGCLNSATIATGDKIVVWLGSNEKSAPVVMYTTGGDAQAISTDGIDFKLAHLTNPKNAYGFLYKQDGHLIYQFCFPDDNLSYIYDFNTGKFFTVTDQTQNYHIAKRVVFFEGSYYFISINDGNLYELNSEYTTFDGEVIPRIVVCSSFRLPDSSYFVINNLTFPIETGVEDETPRVDLSISIDGGESYSSIDGEELRPLGKRQFQLTWFRLGAANDFTPQFRFWGNGRFVFTNGSMSYYQ
jgi:hypothetical protein